MITQWRQEVTVEEASSVALCTRALGARSFQRTAGAGAEAEAEAEVEAAEVEAETGTGTEAAAEAAPLSSAAASRESSTVGCGISPG